MKKFFTTSLMLFVALFMLGSCSKQEQELHVYSIIHDEETKALTELFTKKTGIKVEYLRATTGELLNRVIAEKDNPQADVLLGGASAYHIQADEAGALEVYRPSNINELPSYAKDPNGTWTGFCILTLGIGINQTRFNSKFPNKELPATWEDLLDKDFKNEIVLTNPLSSSTSYLFLQDQLQRLGWDAGWEYLLSLSGLVGQFPDSGSAPPKLVGTGEYAIGVAYLHALAKYKAQGFDITLVSPPQTIGDVDCISIMKNTKNLESAKKFVDFILSKEAQEVMSDITFTIPVNPNVKAKQGSISVSELDLIDYDSEKAAAQKSVILDMWSKNVK